MSVNQKPGGDQQTQLRDTKAVGEGLRSIPASAPCHSRTHVRFIRRFLEGVGIRSAYLQNARLGVAYPWQGRQEQYRQPPDPTIEAPPAYLHLHALVGIELAPPGASILARSCDPMAAVGYRNSISMFALDNEAVEISATPLAHGTLRGRCP